MFFAAIFPPGQRVCNFDTSRTNRNVYRQQSALRSLAIVCDYMETTLFTIVYDLRSTIRDSLRLSAMIWKHTSAIVCDRDHVLSFAIACDRLQSIAIVRSYGNQSFAICDQNVSHNILNSGP